MSEPIDPGTWEVTTDACDCWCPLPTLEVGYSERTDSGFGFAPWTDYDFTNVLGEFNTDPANGGSEQQVRIKFRITNPKGLAGVIRYRQVNNFEGDFKPPETIYEVQETQVYNIPPVVGVTTFEFAMTPCEIGFGAVLVGAPGRATVNIIGDTQAASLNKKGFTRYLPDGLTVHIYKQESVASGGDPGCIESGRPARDYSGHQSFTPGIATEATDWIIDPAGTFEDTRSRNLIDDKHASTPFGRVNQTVEFGTVTYPAVTVKKSVEQFQCGKDNLTKSLELHLSATYSTDDLTGAVDAALDVQQGLGAHVFAINGSCFHRKFLASDETLYSRTRTTSIRAEGSAVLNLATRGAPIDLHVSCVVVARSLTLPATVTRTPKTFTARIYADGYITGSFGRTSHTPDGAGESDIPPEANPWEGDQFEGKEILLTDINVKRHALIVAAPFTPFVEPVSVLAEGVDG